MGRGAAKFRQREVTRAVKALLAAGVEVARVEIGTDGRIVVIAGSPQTQPAAEPAPGKNEWDEKYGTASSSSKS
jgi:hypothetical protein